MRPLSSYRQGSPVPEAPVTADIHQSLDIGGYVPAQISFNLVVAFDLVPYLIDFFRVQFI